MPETQANLPVLTVALGESVDEFSQDLDPALKAVSAEDGKIIATRHELHVMSAGWRFAVPDTRFSSVDFEDGKVCSIVTNPHRDYLPWKGVAMLVEAIESEFGDFGFQIRSEKTVSGDQLREGAAGIAKDPDYNREVYRARRANVMCSLVLKKSVLKDSLIGRLSKTDSDLFLLTLTMRWIKEGDRF